MVSCYRQGLIIGLTFLCLVAHSDAFQSPLWKTPVPTISCTPSHNNKVVIIPKTLLFESDDNGGDGGESPAITTESDTSSTTSTNSKNKTLMSRLDNLGMTFKPRAQKYSTKASQASKWSKKVKFQALMSFYYSLFIFYRAYRGMFVLLPAVYREVYSQLEQLRLYNGDNTNNNDDDNNNDIDNNAEDNNNTNIGKARKIKTFLTISVLAATVTFSYALGGAIRVASKFFQTIIKTSSIAGSFEAAADEVMSNEDGLQKYSKTKSSQNDSINGQDKQDGNSSPKLAP